MLRKVARWIAALAPMVAMLHATPALASDIAPMGPCDYHYEYEIISVDGDELVQTVPTVGIRNQGPNKATLSSSVALSGSVSYSVSVGGSVEGSVIVASVQGSVTASATYTLSASFTTTATVEVDAGQWGFIYGGVFRKITTGAYNFINTQCQIASTKTVVAHTPWLMAYDTCAKPTCAPGMPPNCGTAVANGSATASSCLPEDYIHPDARPYGRGRGDPGGIGSPAPMSVPTAQPAIPMPNNGVEVFARGTNNHLIEWWYTPANGWRTSDMGGDIRGFPVAVPTAGGGIEVFALGGDNTLREWWYTPANGWRTANLGGSIASPPTAFYDSSSGLIEVFARGTNNHLIEFWYTPANGWRTSDMGGDIRDTPVAMATQNGGIEVFARGADNTLREWWYTPANGWRSASQGGSIASAPTAFYDKATGLIEVFARGTNNHLIEFWYTPANGWRTSDMGGDIGDV